MTTNDQSGEINENVVRLISRRQQHEQHGKYLKRKTHFNANLLDRLGLQHCLEGHEGCVNCLEWSKDGRILASGSDDKQVRIWDPFANKCLHTIQTKHTGNIFSVKYLGDGSLIATGAGDCHVMVTSIDGNGDNAHLSCNCHIGRVKRLATCPDNPLLFWSAAEDGLVLQFDMREAHDCAVRASAVLVDLRTTSEIKCIAVNPTKSHQIAIGASDCYVRLYDRRMLKRKDVKKLSEGLRSTQTPSHTLRLSPTPPPAVVTPPTVPSQSPSDHNAVVTYYAPGHLARDNGGEHSYKLAVTYVAYNATGTELLANLGGDHIYLFNVAENDSGGGRVVDRIRMPSSSSSRAKEKEDDVTGMGMEKEEMETAGKALPMTECGCDEYHKRQTMYLKKDSLIDNKIRDYRISNGERCGCAYLNRALKLYKRQWFGDVYAAARDYLYVIEHYPDNLDAYTGFIECMITLRWASEALAWIRFVELHFAAEAAVAERSEFREFKEILGRITAFDEEKLLQQPQQQVLSGRDYENERSDRLVEEEERELRLRLQARDYERRYIGHCNTTTDIKEVNFLGVDNNYLCAGSDDGMIFIWDRKSSNLVSALVADISIVNCVQPHPSICCIASSGIDKEVKMWSPEPEDGRANPHRTDPWKATQANQTRMSLDPFETMLVNMGYHVEPRGDGSDTSRGSLPIPNCNTS